MNQDGAPRPSVPDGTGTGQYAQSGTGQFVAASPPRGMYQGVPVPLQHQHTRPPQGSSFRPGMGAMPSFGGGPVFGSHHPTPRGMMGGQPMGRFCAVKLRGLPFGVREYDIAMFLGVEPIDIVIVMNRRGKPAGDAVAVLGHPSEMDMALRKNKAYLGARYIEVFEARKMDYYKAIIETYSDGKMLSSGMSSDVPLHNNGNRKRNRSRSPVHAKRGTKKSEAKNNGVTNDSSSTIATTPIVKLRGLPFSAGVDRIVEFFQDVVDHLPSVDKVLIATGPDKRPTGMAFVEFDSIETAQKALKKHKESMGSRYIEVFSATEDDRARFLPVT